jgi:glucose-1-phosphate thymidylyltransferase
MEASSFIQAIEERQGQKVGCVQEIAWQNGWITDEGFRREAEAAGNSSYGSYLMDLLVGSGVGRGAD